MKKNQVAVQLYTLREQMKTAEDIAATLKKVRSIGFGVVEAAGTGPLSVEEFAKVVRGEGLTCCSSHEAPEMIIGEPQKVVERLGVLGCKYAVYPWPGGVDFGDAEAVKKLIAGLNEAGRVLHEAGLVLCYHNHHMEFRRVGGRTILDMIFADTDPKFLQAEIDTYWVQYGGANPVAWCSKLNNRVPLVHMKDYGVAKDDKVVFTEVGSGNLNWKGIVNAADASGCKWYIVEQDTCPGDPFECIRQSYAFVTGQLCAG